MVRFRDPGEVFYIKPSAETGNFGPPFWARLEVVWHERNLEILATVQRRLIGAGVPFPVVNRFLKVYLVINAPLTGHIQRSYRLPRHRPASYIPRSYNATGGCGHNPELEWRVAGVDPTSAASMEAPTPLRARERRERSTMGRGCFDLKRSREMPMGSKRSSTRSPLLVPLLPPEHPDTACSLRVPPAVVLRCTSLCAAQCRSVVHLLILIAVFCSPLVDAVTSISASAVVYWSVESGPVSFRSLSTSIFTIVSSYGLRVSHRCTNHKCVRCGMPGRITWATLREPSSRVLLAGGLGTLRAIYVRGAMPSHASGARATHDEERSSLHVVLGFDFGVSGDPTLVARRATRVREDGEDTELISTSRSRRDRDEQELSAWCPTWCSAPTRRSLTSCSAADFDPVLRLRCGRRGLRHLTVRSTSMLDANGWLETAPSPPVSILRCGRPGSRIRYSKTPRSPFRGGIARASHPCKGRHDARYSAPRMLFW
ncbi:hypothetical protein K438DRAFT_1949837 [Mycena galopus ATCC 62051]|nr:hypothetical protein K438DRAFT_1949837 [Mycena galopus ATCC 62051]